jgi:hypothetical protein
MADLSNPVPEYILPIRSGSGDHGHYVSTIFGFIPTSLSLELSLSVPHSFSRAFPNDAFDTFPKNKYYSFKLSSSSLADEPNSR